MLRLLNVMIEEVIERDGAENVVAWSFNLDETNAHVHMYTIPVDEAGRVNMRSKFDGHSKGGAKRAYTERHDMMRTRLNEHGYEATFARIEGSPKHEALAKYKARKEREKQVAEFAEKVMDGDRVNKANAAKIAAAREQLDAGLADLEEAEDDLAERANDIAERETDWLARKRRLDTRERDLDRRDQETADARLAAQRAQRGAEAKRAEIARARELVAKVEHVEPDIDRWLDRRKFGDGSTMRDLFNEDMKKTRVARAEVQALIDGDASPQTHTQDSGYALGS